MNSQNEFSSIPHWDPNDTNFIDNMRLPIHRWFRFPAGFSSAWVKKVINWHSNQKNIDLSDFCVLDPFCGSGTTILSAERLGVCAFGIEAQPFIARIGQTKLLWDVDPKSFQNFSNKVIQSAKENSWEFSEYPNIIHKMYNSDALNDLNSLKSSWESLDDASSESKLTWLAITAILRQTSQGGTAPWQYVLPNKQKKNQIPPFECIKKQTYMMMEDIVNYQLIAKKTGKIILSDSRNDASIPDNEISLVVTSPPYANNYDYADATRLELSFWGEISGWGDLKNIIRKDLVRSCTQHVSSKSSEMEKYLQNLKNTPIEEEITNVANDLAIERMKHGGKKQYNVMIPAYFSDLNLVWKNLRRMCNDNSIIAFVIGDSAPYGIHVPVDKWLGELALNAGFEKYYFEKIKDRNIKWKLENRKHTVPLKEGILWIK